MSGYFLSDLTFKHRVELTLLGDEFFGRTLLYQLAILHHEHHVSLLDGSQTVADGDNCFILFVKQMLEYPCFSQSSFLIIFVFAYLNAII